MSHTQGTADRGEHGGQMNPEQTDTSKKTPSVVGNRVASRLPEARAVAWLTRERGPDLAWPSERLCQVPRPITRHEQWAARSCPSQQAAHPQNATCRPPRPSPLAVCPGVRRRTPLLGCQPQAPNIARRASDFGHSDELEVCLFRAPRRIAAHEPLIPEHAVSPPPLSTAPRPSHAAAPYHHIHHIHHTHRTIASPRRSVCPAAYRR